ncbi:MAG: hypothetical protein IPH28_16875 [Cytophagaceae bacterium]|nr:hypothetical protein [Cytophagaceae bacterium]
MVNVTGDEKGYFHLEFSEDKEPKYLIIALKCGLSALIISELYILFLALSIISASSLKNSSPLNN